MTNDAGDELNAQVTHEKLDRLIEIAERLEGRLEALQASVDTTGDDGQ